MTTILIAILVFSVLILVHEGGHYAFARLFRVKINEFAIGMGPKLVSHTSKKTGIAYSLRLFPIGGFVSMAGEDEESDDENALSRKPVWQRMIITVAGAALNLLLGVILMVCMVCSAHSLTTTTVLRFPEETAMSAQSGLEVGDTIKKVNDTPVYIYFDLAYHLMRQGSEPVTLTVERDGKIQEIKNVQFPTYTEGSLVYAVADFYPTTQAKTLSSVFRHTWRQTVTSVRMIWESLIDLVTGKAGFDQVSGPIGVTQAIGEAAKQGAYNFFYMTALISLNLGIFNLLPIPALDGCRLLFQLIEAVRGKPIKPEWEAYIHFVGLALLMLLMIVVAGKDVIGLFK
jgi:regulator of sigma E protease